MKIISYIIVFALVGLLCFWCVRNVINLVKAIKSRKEKKGVSSDVESKK